MQPSESEEAVVPKIKCGHAKQCPFDYECEEFCRIEAGDMPPDGVQFFNGEKIYYFKEE